MSDLVKRLRDSPFPYDQQAADRIEELERELADAHGIGQACEQWAERLEAENAALKEKLAVIGQIEKSRKTLENLLRETEAENAALKLTCSNALENTNKHLAAREKLESNNSYLQAKLNEANALLKTPGFLWRERAEKAEAENAALRAENSKLRAALAIVHFKQEPLQ